MEGEITSRKTIKNAVAAERMSDAELYGCCQEYGKKARMWAKKFAGLLPEVYRRHLYKRRNFVSIYQFAAELAGMSRDAVDRILDLDENLINKPALRELFVSGAQGWSKIRNVAYIATPQTDKLWAEKVVTLSSPALATYVQEVRKSQKVGPQTLLGDKLPTQQEWGRLSFPVSPGIENKLRARKLELEKKMHRALSWNEVMAELLKGDFVAEAGKTSARQQKIVQICPECETKKANEKEHEGMTKRPIPAAVNTVLTHEYGKKCAYPGCVRPPEILHHTRRFALRKNHDPSFIAPLCKSHERIAHAGLIANEHQAPEQWVVRLEPERNSAAFKIDQKVMQFRRPM